MDLVQTIRKEGSRGGRADFKWEDVKNDTQRENYLGHSLMAPVGRWQQGRDLNWYAKGDAESKEAEAARIAEEKRKLKEAEEDAMLAAMGLPVPVRGEGNANLTPLGKRAHEADVKDAMDGKVEDGEEDRIRRREKKERSRRHRDDDGQRRRHRSRSRSRDHHHRDRRHRHRDRPRSQSRDRKNDREARRHKHRSHSREHRRREDRFEHSGEHSGERDAREKRPRSRSRDRRRRRDSRSKSPYTGHDRRRD